ncbi:uncharacterized protein LOC122650001 [Telopea speciosissima]|uniref:uncharacterized protein LOC122650001 n=1 Tax=Telopea speciosissima TaxID=54955 RepID=UPI001CC48B1E|nr:uncharacterized protein LOC122650001 [Telopea speciosissima]
MAIPSIDADDFSPSTTLISYDRPLPLLRGPIPAGLSDDPSKGPFVLAFRDPSSWKSAFQTCESKVIEQCEAGARIGCSISASNKCKPPWWRSLFGAVTVDVAAREQCEEREMASCLAASKESCLKLGKEKCLPPFRDARIALIDLNEVSKFIFWASPITRRTMWSKSIGSSQLDSCLPSHCDLEVTNYRASVLLESETSIEDSPGKSSCNQESLQ